MGPRTPWSPPQCHEGVACGRDRTRVARAQTCLSAVRTGGPAHRGLETQFRKKGAVSLTALGETDSITSVLGFFSGCCLPRASPGASVPGEADLGPQGMC